MKNGLFFLLIASFVLTACEAQTAVATATVTADVPSAIAIRPTQESTFTPGPPTATPEPIYYIQQHPDLEGNMSTVALEKDPDGKMLLPKSLFDFEQAHPLPIPDSLKNFPGLNINYKCWTQSGLGGGNTEIDIHAGSYGQQNLMQLYSIYKFNMSPFGYNDDVYIMAIQYEDKDLNPIFFHILVSKQYMKRIIGEGLFPNHEYMQVIVNLVTPPLIHVLFPGRETIVDSLYKIQLNAPSIKDANKETVAICTDIGTTDTAPEIAQRLIWFGLSQTYSY